MLNMRNAQTNQNKCFCGSNESFVACCQPFIDDDQSKRIYPNTPEQLMRSRFCAYACGNSQYIYDTYAKRSQAAQSVKEIKDWGEACVWIALQIHSSKGDTLINSKGMADDSSEQFVEFSAFYISDDTLFELRENSRFVLEQGTQKEDESKPAQWRYIDGDILKHEELSVIKRKDLCPCNLFPTAWILKKGKKYKQCCGQQA